LSSASKTVAARGAVPMKTMRNGELTAISYTFAMMSMMSRSTWIGDWLESMS
jgi:hypothetical protein